MKYDNRIEYIFDLIKGRTKESECYYTFNEFYKDFSDKANIKDKNPDIEKLWLNIKKYFLTFEDWFRDNKLYHYIGYLIDCGIDVNTIKNKVEKKSKIEFIEYLEKEIKAQVDCDIDSIKYKNEKVKKILLLFNIQTVLKTQKSDMRFPFYKYKLENWDIEHICSQTDKTIENHPKKRLDWINDILDFFTGETDIDKTKEFILDDDKVKTICNSSDIDKVKNICYSLIELKEEWKKSEKINDDKFNFVFKDVQKYFEEDRQTEEKDEISNLALLDSTTNRSYGNSFFPIKRKRIIENDKNGIFVPIATKNLFLKYYTKIMGKIMYWTDKDADDYLEAIKLTLTDFLPKEKNNE